MNFRHLQKFSVYLNREKLNQISKLTTANQTSKNIATPQNRYESSNSTILTGSNLLERTPTRKLKSTASIRRRRVTFPFRQSFKTFPNNKTSDKKSLRSFKKFERKPKILLNSRRNESNIRRRLSTLLKTLNINSQVQKPSINLLSSNEILKTRKYSKNLSPFWITNITNKIINNLQNNPNLFLQQRRNFSSKSKDTFDKSTKHEKKKRFVNKTCPEPPCDEEKAGLPYFYKRVPVQGEDGESKTYEMQRVYFKYPNAIVATEDASKQHEITPKTNENSPKETHVFEIKAGDQISNSEYIKLLEKTPLKKLEHAYYMKICNDANTNHSQTKRNISTSSTKLKNPPNTPKKSSTKNNSTEIKIKTRPIKSRGIDPTLTKSFWAKPDFKLKKRSKISTANNNQTFYIRTLKSDSKFAENLTSILTKSVEEELKNDMKETEIQFEQQNKSLKEIKSVLKDEINESNLRNISKILPDVLPKTRLSQLEDKSNIQFENPTNENPGRNFRNDILDIIESIKTPGELKRVPPERNYNRPGRSEAPKPPRQLNPTSSRTHQLKPPSKNTSIMDLFKADVQNIIYHLQDAKPTSLEPQNNFQNPSNKKLSAPKQNMSKLVQKTVKTYLDQIYEKKEEPKTASFKINSPDPINRKFERQPQFLSFRVPEIVPPVKTDKKPLSDDTKVTTKIFDFSKVEEIEVSVPFEEMAIRQSLHQDPKTDAVIKKSSKQSISNMEHLISSVRQSSSKLGFEQASKKCLSKSAINSGRNDDKTKNLPFYQISKIPKPLKLNKAQYGQLDMEDIKDAILKMKLSKQEEIQPENPAIHEISHQKCSSNLKNDQTVEALPPKPTLQSPEDKIHTRIIDSLKLISNIIEEKFMAEETPEDQPKIVFNTPKNNTDEMLMLTTNIIKQLEAISSARESQNDESDDEGASHELPHELLELLQTNTLQLKELLELEEAKKQDVASSNTVQLQIELSDNVMETFAERLKNFVFDIKQLSNNNLFTDPKISTAPPKIHSSTLQLLKQNYSTINQADDTSNKNKSSKTKVPSDVTIKTSEDELKIRKLADKLFHEYLLRKQRQVQAKNNAKPILSNLKPVDSKVNLVDKVKVPPKKPMQVNVLLPKPEKLSKEPSQEVAYKSKSSFKPYQEPPKEDYFSNIIRNVEKELNGPAKVDKTPSTTNKLDSRPIKMPDWQKTPPKNPSQHLKELKSKEVTRKVIQAVDNVVSKSKQVNNSLKLNPEKEAPANRVRDPPPSGNKRGSYSIIEPIDGIVRPVVPPKNKSKPTLDMKPTGGLQPSTSLKHIRDKPDNSVQIHTDHKSDKNPIIDAIEKIFPKVKPIAPIISKENKSIEQSTSLLPKPASEVPVVQTIPKATKPEENPTSLPPKPALQVPVIQSQVNNYIKHRPVYLDPTVKKLKKLPVTSSTVLSKRKDSSKFLTRKEKAELYQILNPNAPPKLLDETIDDTLKIYLKKSIKAIETSGDKILMKDESLNTWEPTSGEFSQTIKKPDKTTPENTPVVPDNNVEVLRKKELEKYNHVYDENNPSDAQRLEIYRNSSSSKEFEDSFTKTFKRTMSDFSIRPNSRKMHSSSRKQYPQIPNKKTPKIPIGIRKDYSNKYEIKYLSDKNVSLDNKTQSMINLLHPPVNTSQNNNTSYKLPFKQQEASDRTIDLLNNIKKIANRPLKTPSETIINMSTPENNTKISENTATYLYISLRIPPEMDQKINETIAKFSESIDAELEIDSNDSKQIGLTLSLVSPTEEVKAPESSSYLDNPFGVNRSDELLINNLSKYKKETLVPKDYTNIFADLLKPNELSEMDNAKIHSEIEDLFSCLANCEKINNTDISMDKNSKFDYPLKDLDTLVDALSNETKNFPFHYMDYNKSINQANVIQVYNLHEMQKFQDIQKNKESLQGAMECSTKSKDPFGRKKPDPYDGKYQEPCSGSSDFLQKLDLRCDMKSSGAEVPKQPPPPGAPCCNPFEMPVEVECDDISAEEKAERLKQLHCSMINYEPKIEPPSTTKKCPIAAKPRKKKKIGPPCQRKSKPKKVVCKKPGKSVCKGKNKSKDKKKKKCQLSSSKSAKSSDPTDKCKSVAKKKSASSCQKPRSESKSPCGSTKKESAKKSSDPTDKCRSVAKKKSSSSCRKSRSKSKKKSKSVCAKKSPCASTKAKSKSPCGDSKPKNQASACKPRKKSKSPCGSSKAKSKSPCGDSKPKKQASACKPRKKSKSPCVSSKAKSKSPCGDSKTKKQASACKPRKKSKSPCGSSKAKSKSPCGDSKPKKQASACKPRKKSKSPCGSSKAKSKSPCGDSKPKKQASACKPKKKSKSPCGSTKKKASSCRKSRSKSKSSCKPAKTKSKSPCDSDKKKSRCKSKSPSSDAASKCRNKLKPKSSKCMSSLAGDSESVKSFCDKKKSKESVKVKSFCEKSKSKTSISKDKPAKKKSKVSLSNSLPPPSCKSSSGKPSKPPKGKGPACGSPKTTISGSKLNLSTSCNNKNIVTIKFDYNQMLKPFSNETHTKKNITTEPPKDVEDYCNAQKRKCDCKPKKPSCLDDEKDIFSKICRKQKKRKRSNKSVCPYRKSSSQSVCKPNKPKAGKCVAKKPKPRVKPDPFDSVPSKEALAKLSGDRSSKNASCPTKNPYKKVLGSKIQKSASCKSESKDCSKRNRLPKKKDSSCRDRNSNYPKLSKKRLTPCEKLQNKVPNCDLKNPCTKLKKPKGRGKKCKKSGNKRYSSTHSISEDISSKFMTNLFNSTSKEYISKIKSQTNQNSIPLKDKPFTSYKFYQDDATNYGEALYKRKLQNKLPWKTSERPKFYYNPKKINLTPLKKKRYAVSPFTCVKANVEEPSSINYKVQLAGQFYPKKFNPCEREFMLPVKQWHESLTKASTTSIASKSRSIVGSFSEQPLTKFRTSRESFTRSNCSDCGKKEDLCKNNQDPCIKKKNPCKPKKIDTCPKKRCTYPKKKKLITKPLSTKKSCKLLKEQSPCEQENPCKRIKEMHQCSDKDNDNSCKQEKDKTKPCQVPSKGKQKTTCKITKVKKKTSIPKTTCKPKRETKPNCCPKKKKPNPCKESCTPKKKKEDPCKSTPPKDDVDPCKPKKKKSEPCKKKDPCKKKKDPCKKKNDTCKPKKCAPGNAHSVICPTSEKNYEKLLIASYKTKNDFDPWNKEVNLVPNTPKSTINSFRKPRLISSKYQKHPLSYCQVAWNDLYMRLFSSCKKKKKPPICQANPCADDDPCGQNKDDDCDDDPCPERDIAESKQIQPHPKDPPTPQSMKCLKFMEVPKDEEEKPNAKRRYRMDRNPCGKDSKPLCPKNVDPCHVDVTDIEPIPADDEKPQHPCRMLQQGNQKNNEFEEKYKELLRLSKLCKNGPNPWCKKVILVPCGRTGNAAQCTPGPRPDPDAKKEYVPSKMCLPPKFVKKDKPDAKKKTNPCDEEPKEVSNKIPPRKKQKFIPPERKENVVNKKMEALCGSLDKSLEDPCAKKSKSKDLCAKKSKSKDPCAKKSKSKDPCAKKSKSKDPCQKKEKPKSVCKKPESKKPEKKDPCRLKKPETKSACKKPEKKNPCEMKKPEAKSVCKKSDKEFKCREDSDKKGKKDLPKPSSCKKFSTYSKSGGNGKCYSHYTRELAHEACPRITSHCKPPVEVTPYIYSKPKSPKSKPPIIFQSSIKQNKSVSTSYIYKVNNNDLIINNGNTKFFNKPKSPRVLRRLDPLTLQKQSLEVIPDKIKDDTPGVPVQRVLSNERTKKMIVLIEKKKKLANEAMSALPKYYQNESEFTQMLSMVENRKKLGYYGVTPEGPVQESTCTLETKRLNRKGPKIPGPTSKKRPGLEKPMFGVRKIYLPPPTGGNNN